jgi:predicted nucleic acid-binding protein
VPLLVDTGVLYALADADDAWHERSKAYLLKNRDLLLAPVTVLPEVAYLLRLRLGARAETAFARSLADGELAVQDVTADDFRRCVALMGTYPDIGLVDASVVAVAERLRVKVIATTDRRHFASVRPRHLRAFELVP